MQVLCEVKHRCSVVHVGWINPVHKYSLGLWRKGPGNHGEQKIDHQPAVSPCTEGDQLHLGLYWDGHSQQIKGYGSFPMLSTPEINSVVLHPSLGSPVRCSRGWVEHQVYEEKLKALGLNNFRFELKDLRRKS